MNTPITTRALRRNPYAESLDIERLENGVGTARFAYNTRPQDLNGADGIHGGILAGLMDLILAMAAGTHPDPAQRQFSITLSMTINFIAAAPPGRLVCTGQRIGGGRRNVFCEARIEDADGNVCATGSGTFKLLPPGE
jgi:uncharacterized protein (TIGR00369 family)